MNTPPRQRQKNLDEDEDSRTMFEKMMEAEEPNPPKWPKQKDGWRMD